MRIFVRMSFYGANYLGTQKQLKGHTVQGEFESLLSRIYAEKVKTTISSRLDRGVNALDFAVTFDAPKDNIDLEHLKYYLQRGVSEDCVIRDLRSVRDDFSPRYDCSYKTYVYMIQNASLPNPLLNPVTYLPHHPLDQDKIREALNLFQGRHDFRSFATPEGEENTILDLDEVSMEERQGILYLRFRGKAFLRYQVRFMVGACISHAMGKLSLEQIESMLNGNHVKYVKFKAPGNGLTLEHICYPEIEDDHNCVTIPTVLFS